MLTLTPKELSLLLETSPEAITLIDVRNIDEYEEIHIPEALLIPLHLLPLRQGEIDRTKQIIFICRSGGRSGQACQFFEKEEIKSYNLLGGMNDFSVQFPEKILHGKKKTP